MSEAQEEVRVEDVDLRAAVEAGQNEEVESTIQDESPKYTEIEQQAMADGWIPPDRFDKSEQGKDFISAEKFIENGSFFKKINSQKERIEQLEQSFSQLKSHHERVAENEHKKAQAEYEGIIAELKAEKVRAIEEGDGRRVVEIDDKISETQKPVAEAKPESDPVYSAWEEQNPWYKENKFLSVEADIIAEKYLAKGMRGKELLDAMTDHIKISHKEHFKDERKRPAAVEGDTRGQVRTTSKTVSVKDLTPDEREVFNNFNRMGMFPDEKAKTKYFNEVIELRD